jgi:hypothetical protein
MYGWLRRLRLATIGPRKRNAGQLSKRFTMKSLTQPPQVNRLTIAHLLLWTATTAVALSQCGRPPPLSEIGVGDLVMPADSDAQKAELQQQIRRILEKQYLVGLTFAPIYGLALAGMVLAGWRTVTARFGFPAQPGHWLLVVIGGATTLMAAKLQLQSLPSASNGVQSLLAVIATAMSLVAGMKVGNSPWRYPFFTFAGSLILLALVPVMQSEGPTLFAIALIGSGGIPFMGLLCAGADLADRKRFDVFHWIGVATLFGVAGHFVGLFLTL